MAHVLRLLQVPIRKATTDLPTADGLLVLRVDLQSPHEEVEGLLPVEFKRPTKLEVHLEKRADLSAVVYDVALFVGPFPALVLDHTQAGAQDVR